MGRKVTPRKKKEVAKPQETKNESLKGDDGLSVEDEENKQSGDVSNGDEKKETVEKMEVDVEPETGGKPNEAAAGDVADTTSTTTTTTTTVSKPANTTEKEDGDSQEKEELDDENEDEKSATDGAVKEVEDEKAEETKDDKENGEVEKPAEDIKTDKAKKPKHPVVWVSNISRSVKATDLKKHFSQHGKVVTAKIVTNGRSFFGYVCLDSIEAAEKCVQSLNNSDFEGRKIIVSIEKPDRDERIKIRNPPKDKGEPVEKVAKYDPLTTTYEEPPAAKKPEEKEKSVTKSEDVKKKPPKSNQKLTEDELRREVANCEREIDRLRSRLIEEQAHCRMEMKRCRRFERELGDAEMKIREDRKKFEREREEITKKNRLEQLRLDADRVILDRDRMELTRQRAEFERDLRRFVEEQQRAPVRVPTPPRISKRFRADDDSKDGWNIDVDSGPERQDPPKGGSYFRDGPSQSRSGGGGGGGVVYFPNQVWNNGPPGVGSSGSGQWRSMTGPSQGSSQSFFRNESSGGGYRGSSGGFSKGSGGFSKGPGGFRGPYDSGSGGNF